MLSKFEISSHKYNCKVRVSEALDADANGTYIHAGVHCGQPAYRQASRSNVFWICYDGSVWLVWRQKDRKSVCHNDPWIEQSGIAKAKLPTGHWYGAKKEVHCKLEYICEEKAHLLNDSSDVISLSGSLSICQMAQTECIHCVCLIMWMRNSQVSVSAATIDACNGMYHGDPESRFYENNRGGIIYFHNGQWRLTTRTMSTDGRVVRGMAYGAELLYFVNSSEPQPPFGQWSSVDGAGQCKVEASPIEISRKLPR